jgi:molybdenum cofactor synthesis domain-containing protein
MIPIDEARALVLDACRVLPVVDVEAPDMVGRVLAQDVVAAENVPPFANSAVDGFGVRSVDVASVPARLRIVGTLAAGAAPEISIGPGEAVRIMTGAVIPSGVDAVVMVEDSTMVDADHVELTKVVPPGGAIRDEGSDVVAGSTVFRSGQVLNAAGIGVLASINARRVKSIARARVALLSTGDELIIDGSPLKPGQIRESNLTMLERMIRDTGCDVDNLGVVRDDEDTLVEVLTRAVENCDAIVTSGGVSMGDFDVVKAVLSRYAEMRWMQLAIKPAKPFAFGLWKTASGAAVPIFGLPGNPVSSLISYELMARPALRQMMGHTQDLLRPKIRAVLDAPISRKPDGKVHYVRVHGSFAPDGRLHVRDTGPQGSHQLAATALANGLAEVPDGPGLAVGADVDVLLID